MKIARGIFNALTFIAILLMIACVCLGRNIFMMIFLMLTIIFLSISDNINQKQEQNEMRRKYKDENLVKLNKSSNPIWNEVRENGSCYMKIQGDIAIIKFVIGEKEIKIEPIKLTEIEKYINVD